MIQISFWALESRENRILIIWYMCVCVSTVTLNSKTWWPLLILVYTDVSRMLKFSENSEGNLKDGVKHFKVLSV